MKSVTRLIIALDEEQLHTSNNVVVIDMRTDHTTVLITPYIVCGNNKSIPKHRKQPPIPPSYLCCVISSDHWYSDVQRPCSFMLDNSITNTMFIIVFFFFISKIQVLSEYTQYS